MFLSTPQPRSLALRALRISWAVLQCVALFLCQTVAALGGISSNYTTAGTITDNITGGVVNGGALNSNQVSGGDILISGQGTLNLLSGGTLRIGGAGSVNTMTGGVLSISAAATVGSISAGTALLAGVSSVGTLSGGSLTLSLSIATNTITNLNGGVITNYGILQVSTGIYGSNMGGSGSLDKIGPGTLALNAANTFTGGVKVSGGVLGINNAGALGTGTLTLSGGDIDNQTVGTITLNKLNQQRWNSDFRFIGTNSLMFDTGAITLGNAVTVTVSNSTLGQGGVISGGYALTKAGLGTLLLSGNNTYTGGTVIREGTLQVGSNGVTGSLPSTGSITNNGLLVFQRSNTATQGSQFGTVISGSGMVQQAGTGILILSGSNTFTGGFQFSSGRVHVNSASALGRGTITISGGSLDNSSGSAVTLTTNNPQVWNTSFTFEGSNPLNLGTGDVTLSANQTLTVTAKTLTVGGAIGDSGNAFALIKAGAGTLALSGASSYSGGTRITDGSLLLAGANDRLPTSGSISITGGFFDLGGFSQTTSGTISIDGGVIQNGTLSASGMDFQALSGTITASLAGSYGLVKSGSGSLTLSGSNSYTGDTILAEGFLNINSSRAIPGGTLILSGGILDNTSGTSKTLSQNPRQIWDADLLFAGSNPLNLGTGDVNLSANRSVTIQASTLTVGGVIAGTGMELSKEGAGRLELTAANTYTGTTSVNAGILSISGSGRLANGADVQVARDALFQYAPTTSGTLSLGTFNLAAGSNFGVNWGSSILAAGIATSTGIVGLKIDGSFTSGTPYTILSAAPGSTLDSAAYSITGSSEFDFTIVRTSTLLQITPRPATTMTAAYWMGGLYTNFEKNWAVSNWAADAAGTATSRIPQSTTTVYLSASGALASNMTGMVLGKSLDIRGLVVTAASNMSLLNPDAFLLTIGSSGVTVNPGAGAFASDAIAVLSAGQTWTVNGGTFTSNGAVRLAGFTLGVAGTGNTTINGGVGGTGSLTKSGSGMLTLAGTNSFSGTTTLSAGVLNLNHSLALSGSSASFVVTGGTIDNTSGSPVTLAKLSGQTWNGNLNFTGTNPLNLGLTNITFSANRSLNVASGVLTIGGTLKGGGSSFTKLGPGTLILTGSNTTTNAAYSGQTVISAGTLQLGDGGTSGVLSTASQIKNDATLVFNHSNDLTQLADFGNSVISGSGQVIKDGTGALQLHQPNTFSGGLVLNSGLLNLVAVTGTYTIVSQDSPIGTGRLTINGGSINGTGMYSVRLYSYNPQTWNANFTYPGSLWLDLGGGDVTMGTSVEITTEANTLRVGGGISGNGFSLTKHGAGRLVLSGTNTYTGTTTIDGGILQLGLDDNYSDPGPSGSLNGTGEIINNGALRFYVTKNLVQGVGFGPLISGSGSVSQEGSGNTTFNASNTYTGGTTVTDGGLLLVGGNNRLYPTGDIFVTGGILDFGGWSQSTSGAIRFAGGLVRSGMLTSLASRFDGQAGTVSAVLASVYGLDKTTTGELTLSGNSTFSGGVNHTAGYLNINGSGTGPTNSPIGTGAFTLAGGSIDNTSGSSQTLATNNVQAWNADFIFRGSNALNLGTGNVSLSATRSVTAKASVLTVGGVISGPGYGLTKKGAGTLNLTGVNTYSGTTQVSGGILRVSGAGLLNSSTALKVGRDTEFDFIPSAATATNIVNQTVSSLTLSGGSTLGLKWGSGIASTGIASTPLNGVIGLNLIGVGSGTTPDYISGRTYTLISGGVGSTISAGTYAVLGTADFEYVLNISPTALLITPTYSGPFTSAYWVGNQSSTYPREWATTNWSTSADGTALTKRIPTDTTTVYLAAANAASTYMTNMTIGFNMGIRGLVVNTPQPANLTDPDAFILALGSGGITLNSGAGSFATDATLLLTGNQTWSNTGAGTLTITGALDTAGYSIDVTGPSPTFMSSAISGAGSMSKSGSGQLTMSGTNTFSGGFTMNSGVLNISSPTALGAAQNASPARVTITGGTLDNVSGGSLTLTSNNPITWTGDIIFLGSAPLNLGAGAVDLVAGTRSVTVAASTLKLAGPISSGTLIPGGIKKDGPGILELSGANTYAGGTALNAGTLLISGGYLSGRYDLATGTTMEISADMTGADSYPNATTFAGSGTLKLTGNAVFGNPNRNPAVNTSISLSSSALIWVTNNAYVRASAGYLGQWAANQADLLVDAGATIDFQDGGAWPAGSAWIDALNGAGTVKGGAVVNATNIPTTLHIGVANGSGLFSGSITDSAYTLSLAKDGTGTQILSGANSYLGQTFINAGTLQIGNGGNTGSLAGSAGGSIVNNATLLFVRSYIATQGLEFASLISGTGSVINAGSAPLVLNGNNTFSGGVTLNTGRLYINASGTNTTNSAIGTGTLTIFSGDLDNTFGSSITLGTNNRQLWNGDFTFIGTNALNTGKGLVTLTGNRSVTVSASTLTVGGEIEGGSYGMTKAGPGLLVLTGTSSFVGRTTISAGTIQLGDGGTTGSLASQYITNNATLVFYRSNTIEQGTAFSSDISGTGAVFQNGSGVTILSAANAYTGGTTVNAGSLILATGDDRLSTVGDITANAGYLDLAGWKQITSGLITFAGGTVQNGTLTASGRPFNGLRGIVTAALVGTYSLDKTTTGVLTLGGSSTFSGGVNLTAGQININYSGSDATNSALGTGTFTITGGQFDNTSGALVSIASNPKQRWNSNLTFVGSNSLDLGSGDVSLSATRSVTVSANTLTVGGVITDGGGTYGVTKTGSGTLILNGSNTFTGPITASQGRLILGNQANLGSSAVSRTLTVSAGAFLQLSTAMSLGATGSAAILLTGGGSLEINPGAGQVVSLNNGSGAVTMALSNWIDIRSGALRNGAYQLQNWTGNTASLNIAAGAAFLPWDGAQVYVNALTGSGFLGGPDNLVTSSGIVVGVNNGSGTFSGVISNMDGDFVKMGTGTQTLNGASTFGGRTKIWNGELSIASLNSISGGSAASHLGAPLDAARGTISLGSLTTTGKLTYTGSGETTDRPLDLAGTTGSGIVNHSGTGVLKFVGGVSSTGSGDKSLTIQGSTSGIGELAGVIADGVAGKVSITKSGTGQWILSGANTFTGTTLLSAGSLVLGNNLALQNSPVNPTNLGTVSTLTGVTTPTFGGLFGSSNLIVTNSILGLSLNAASGGSYTFSGVITGSPTLALRKIGSGSQTLTGVQTYTGGTTVSDGTLILSGGTNRLSTSGDITVAGGVLNLGGSLQTTSGTVTISGGLLESGTLVSTASPFQGVSGSVTAILGGTQGLTQIGPGILYMRSRSTYSGQTTIKAGSLVLSLGNNTLPTSGAIRSEGGILDLGGFTQSTSGTITLAGGTLQNGTLTATGTSIVAQSGSVFAIIAGTLGIDVNGPGVVSLESANTFSGLTSISGGTLRLNNERSIQNSILNASGQGALIFGSNTASLLVLGLTGSGNLSASAEAGAGTLRITPSGTSVFSGSLSGANVSVIVAGTGTQTFSGVNAYTGSTSVNSGSLTVSGGGALPATTTLSVATGAQFNYLPATAGSLTIGALSLADGGTIGLSWGSTIRSVQNISNAGVTKLSLSGAFSSGTTYTLLTGASGSGLLFEGFRVGAPQNFDYSLTVTPSQVQIVPFTQTSLLHAYWMGTRSLTAPHEWSDSNWLKEPTTPIYTPLVPSSITTVHLTPSLVQSGDFVGMKLSSSMSILALEISADSPISLLPDGGYQLTIGSGGLTLTSGSSLVSISPLISLGANQTWSNAGTGLLTFGGTLNTAGYSLTLTGAGQTSFGGVISGSGSIVKSGEGTTSLLTSNSYTGGTTINAGTLLLAGGANRLPTAGSLNAAGGVLDLGGLAQVFSGTLTVSGGTVQNGSVTLSGASLDARSGTVSAVLSGTAGLTKSTYGTLFLTGVNSYSGPTVVSQGTLAISGSGSLSGASSLSVAGGGWLTYQPLTPGTLNVSALNLAHSGTVSLSWGSRIASSGFAVSAGTVNLTFTGDYDSDETYTIFTGPAGSLLNVGTYSVLEGADFEYTMKISPTLVQITPVSLSPMAATYWVGGVAATAPKVWSSNNWSKDLAGLSTTRRIPGAASTVYFSATNASPSHMIGMTLGADLSVAGIVVTSASPLSLLDSGTSTLSVGTGGISVQPGAGRVALDSAILLDGDQTWTNQSAATLSFGGIISNAGYRLTVAGSGRTVISGSLNGTGTLTKSGTSLLELTGANTYSGQTIVTGGTLSAAAGALANTGSLSVSAGSLSAADLNPLATVTIEGSARASFSAGGLSLGNVVNLSTAATGLSFGSAAGTVTLSSLSGAGHTAFGANAVIESAIQDGAISVAGSLTADINGGSISAETLRSGTLSGGAVTVQGIARIDSVSGGSLNALGGANVASLSGGTVLLSNAPSSVGTLTGGDIQNNGSLFVANLTGGSIQNNGGLSASTGAFSGTLSGAGSLSTNGVLSLSGSLGSFSGALFVQTGGSLQVSNLLAGTNALSIGPGASARFSQAAFNLDNVMNSGSLQMDSPLGSFVQVGTLSGTGTSRFSSDAVVGLALGTQGIASFLQNATITSGIANGEVTVAGTALVQGPLSGGSLTLAGAGPHSVSSISGGSLNITGTSTTSLGNVSGGYISLANNAEANAPVISGGTIALQGTLTAANLTGGVLSNAGLMTVSGGTFNGTLLGSGTLSTTGRLSLGGSTSGFSGQMLVSSGGDLTVNSALAGQNNLSVDASGKAAFSRATLTLGTVVNAGSIEFTDATGSGSITLSSLSGAGHTAFGANAVIESTIQDGAITVAGSLTGDINGGNISAGTLRSGTLSGGAVTVQGIARIDSLSGGSLNALGGANVGSLSGGTVLLSNAPSSVGTLTGGDVQNNGSLSVANLTGGSIQNNGDLSASTGAFSGTLSGAGSLSTNGVLSLSGSLGSFSGALFVQTGGSLQISNLLAGTNALSIDSGASARFSQSGLTLGNVLNSGSLFLDNPVGTVSLSSISGPGTTTFGGSLTIGVCNDGVFSSTNGGMLTILSGSGGLVQSATTTRIDILTDTALNLTNGANVVVTGGSSSASISGFGSLEKNGPSTLTLSGSNSFTLGTVVNAGTLNVLASGSLGTGTDLRIAVGATANIAYLSANLGLVNNSGILALQATSGTVQVGTLSGSGASRFSSDAAVGLALDAQGVATFLKSATITSDIENGEVSILGTATIQGTLSGGSLTFAGSGSNSIAGVSGGSLNISSASTNALGNVSGGYVALDTGAVAAASVVSGGTIAIQGTLNVTTLTDGLLSNNGLLSVSNGTFNGTLAGSGTLSTNGKLTLSGSASAFTGRLAVSNGGDLTVNAALAGQTHMSIDATGKAAFSGASVSLGNVVNAGSLAFTDNTETGSVSLISLSGAGHTSFAANAVITAGIQEGFVTAARSLTADISGGTVSAGSLRTGTLSGGQVSVGGTTHIDTLSGGSLNALGSSNIGSLSGGTVVFANAASNVGTLTGGNIQNNGSLTVANLTSGNIQNDGMLTASNGAFAGTLSGAGSLSATGVLSLAGSLGSFSGALFVQSGGSLQLGTPLAGGNALSIQSGASARLSQSGFTLGNVTNSGSLWMDSPLGSVARVGTLSGSGASSFSSDAVVGLALDAQGVATFLKSATITSDIENGEVSILGTATIQGTLSGGSLTFAGNGSNSIAGVSGGSLNISAASTNALGNVSGGYVALDTGAVAAASVVSGGTIAIQGTLNVTTLTDGLLSNNGLLSVTNGTFNGTLAGSGTLSTNGKLTLSGSASAFTGRLAVSNGGDLTVNAALAGQTNVSIDATGRATFNRTSVALGTVANAGALEFTNDTGTASILSLEGPASSTNTFSTIANVERLSSMGLTQVKGGALTVQAPASNLGSLHVFEKARADFRAATNFASVAADGAVSVRDGTQIGHLTGNGSVVSAGNLCIGSGTFSGQLQIGGSLVKNTSGTFVLSSSTRQAVQSTLVESGDLLLQGTNILDPSGKMEVLAGGLFAVMNGDGQIFDSITVHDGAAIGLPGYDGYIKATTLNLGAATYYLTPVALSAVNSSLVEAQTKGSTKMLNGVGQLNASSNASSNSFTRFTFDLGGQSSGAAVISGKVYSDALVLTGSSPGTLQVDAATDFSNVHTLVVGAANSNGVQLDVRNYNGGTLAVGGTSQRPGVLQTVQGSGSILGNLRIGSSATLAPGNSPGILNVVGSTTVDPGGALQFEYTANKTTEAGTGPNDALHIAGGFTSSGTISAIAYDASGAARVTDLKRHVIEIITYGTGPNPALNGSIPSYVNSGGNLVKSLTIEASLNSGTYGMVQLIIQRQSIGAGGIGNIAATGKLLDAALSQTSGPLADLIALLDTQPSENAIREFLSALNPAVYTELPNLSFARTTDLNTALEGHLNTLAIGSLDDSGADGIHLWNTTYGSSQTRTGEPAMGIFGYSASSFGNASGVETKLGAMTVGVSGAAGSSSASFGSGKGSVSTDTWTGGTYLSVPFGQLVFGGAVGYGNADTSVKRSKNFLSTVDTRVNLEDSEWLAQIGMSWPLSPGSLLVTPSVNLFYSGYREDAVRENGTGGMGLLSQIKARTFHSEALKTGVQIAKQTQLHKTPVRLSCTLDWLHSFDVDQRSTVDIGSTDLPGVTQSFQSAKAGAESVRFGVGCEWNPTRRTTIRVNALNQVQSGQRTTNGNLTIGIAF